MKKKNLLYKHSVWLFHLYLKTWVRIGDEINCFYLSFSKLLILLTSFWTFCSLLGLYNTTILEMCARNVCGTHWTEVHIYVYGTYHTLKLPTKPKYLITYLLIKHSWNIDINESSHITTFTTLVFQLIINFHFLSFVGLMWLLIVRRNIRG